MNDDRELADLLDSAPARSPDPGFRFDVLSRVSERAARRTALSRALNQVAVFAAIGLVFPIAEAAGLDWAAARPMLIAAAALSVAGLAAMVTIWGPRAVLSRSRALFGA